ncbi:MAG TPA: hypothetical protein VFW68_14715, partial [Rhodocyclaceae bacterium]|nr:hypothetical protein [Rhodocyclaceae bacterium]
ALDLDADHKTSSFRPFGKLRTGRAVPEPESRGSCGPFWIPAFAGMTTSLRFRRRDIYSGQQCAFAGMTGAVWGISPFM